MRPRGGDAPSGGELLGLSGIVAMSVLVPLIAGLALDGATHRSPLFLMIGLVLGIAAGAITVYTRFRRYL